MAIVTKYGRTNRVTTGVHICTGTGFERERNVNILRPGEQNFLEVLSTDCLATSKE